MTILSRFLLSLFFFLNFHFSNAQDHYPEILKAIRDSSYPLANYYLDKIKITEYGEQLIQLKLYSLFQLNNADERCQYLTFAKRLGVENEFTKYYTSFHCERNMKKLPDYLKDLYEQKNQTAKNGYYGHFTKSDTLRGSDNVNRRCFNVHHYKLDIRFNLKTQTISGYSQIDFVWKEPSDTIQLDAHAQLRIDSVKLSGSRIPFVRTGNIIYVTNTSNLIAGSPYSIIVYYNSKPKEAVKPPWLGGFVWENHRESKVWAGVACEHLGASFWWPCKDFTQDEPDSMSLNFEVAKPYKVISNGNMISESVTTDQYNRFCWKVISPINTYNATFYIGDYKKLEQDYLDINGQRQTLKYYVLPYKENEALRYFSFASEVLAFYEKAFGEYPFWKDGFAMIESPYKGMEHQSAIAIGSGFRKETDKDRNRYFKVQDDYLIIHETAHEWWGNSVTAFDMADAWLQEGFATYSEYLFIEHKYGSGVFIEELNRLRYNLLNKWPLIGTRGVNDNSFIGGDIYSKGALLIQNIRASIGNDSLFLAVLKGFAIDNKHKIVSSEDFKKYLRVHTGRDFSELFHVYLNTLNIPTIEYELKINEFEEKELSYKWINVPAGFTMPFAIKINNNKYKRIGATTEIQTLKLSAGENFNFFGSQVSFNGAPANYYSHFNTRPQK